jgi:hypothetical protein
MDATDRKILDVLQQDFPLTERPYDVLAKNEYRQRRAFRAGFELVEKYGV